MQEWNEQAKQQLDEQGYVIFEHLISDEQADYMYGAVQAIAKWERAQGEAFVYGEGRNQRIWNLLNKGKVFIESLEHPTILAAMKYLLGQSVILSSWTANIIGPGGSRGELHADVPLGMLPDPLPAIPLSANSVWVLNGFTAENGATLAIPASHRSLANPKAEDNNRTDLVPLVAPKGSVIVFQGALWHGNGANTTEEDRVALLGYFCKSYLRPMEDWQRIVDPVILEQASSGLKKLVGLGYGIYEGTLAKPPADLPF